MARARARVPHTLLRTILLLVGIAMVAALGVLLAAHRFGSPPEEGLAVGTEAETGDDLFRSEGFNFTQTVGGRKVFTIRAQGFRQDRDDVAHLSSVTLDVFRPNGESYRVISDQADYHAGTLRAELRGHVTLRGQTLELDARALVLSHEGNVLTSVGAVAFRYPPHLAGRASTLRADLQEDRLALGGGVHVHSTEAAEVPFRLACDRLNHQRDLGVFRAVGEVRLTRGEDRLAAENLTAHFENDLRDLRSLRARIGVDGSFVLDPAGNRRQATFRGNMLSVLFDAVAATPRRVELEALEGSTAGFEVVDDGGYGHTFDGRYLVAYLEQGDLRLVEGFGDTLRLEEVIALDRPLVLRQACANRLEARFDAGGALGQVQLEGQVELAEPGRFLTGGAQAAVDWAGGAIDIRGPAVSLLDPRGEVVAPHFVYRRDRGVIRAEDGVRAVLAENTVGALGDAPLAQGEGPIRVESERATWTLTPPTFSFLGKVRAWRDQSLVLAEQLRGEQNGQLITASGEVKTIWRSIGGGGTLGGGQDPIEVTAQRLDYRQAENQLVYAGNVAVVQTGRRLTCREMTVELDAASGQAERLRCEQDVHLDDPAADRKIDAERAVYTLLSEQVEFFGEAVVLRDADGSTVTSRYLRYDVAQGTMRLQRERPDQPAPAAATGGGAPPGSTGGAR